MRPKAPRPRAKKAKACGKRRFYDRIAAELALATIINRGDARGKTPCRAYRCPRCNGWHLTSQGKRRPDLGDGTITP